MCSTCGCGQPENEVKIALIGEEEKFKASGHSHPHSNVMSPDPEKNSISISQRHQHDPDHEHPHVHDADHRVHERIIIPVEEDILSRNNLLAERNRGFLEAKNITTLNLVSSPGSGKTSLLEKTLEKLRDRYPAFVIEGDQQTSFDAERIKATGVKVVQVNTGQGCHLDAQMVNRAIQLLDPAQDSFLFIENVGNLVCPALFDLGESKRVVIISVTEGIDKPLKYPNMFQTSQLCVINKTDLLPYVDFDISKVKEYALRVNHHLGFIEMSVKTGEGLERWVSWLEEQVKSLQSK